MGRAARRYELTVRQQRTGVLEDDHAVAQEAPSLLGMRDHGAGGVAVGAFR
jgi:hypothetical protein